jgi:AcrR family transcriptional regulator
MQTVSCPAEEKVDPRVRRTRKLIEDAFRALLAERAFGQISIADVTERATVNRATFYAHYEDKQHLATTILRDDLHGAMLARLTPGTPLCAESLTDVADALFEFMGRTLRACPKHHDEFRETFSVTLQETIRRFIEEWIDHDPKAMSAFPGAAQETVVTVLGWSLYGGAIQWSTQAPRPPASLAAQRVVALLLRSSGGPKRGEPR